MEQTFRKSIDGKTLLFSRLLYPLRYAVKSADYDSNGTMVEFKKDGDGAWKPFIDGKSEFWFKEKAQEINSIIQSNEAV